MNNEIQLSSLGNAVPMYPAVPGPGGGLGGYGGGPQPPREESPFRKLHRLLRGRYLLAFALGLVGAAAGAAAGFMSQKPTYRADALIEIRPVITGSGKNSGDKDAVMTMFQPYINAQIAKLTSDKLVRAAMQDPRWKAVRPGPVTDAAINAFEDKLTVGLAPRNNTIIAISYAEPGADSSKVAPAAVQSLLKAYWTEYENDDTVTVGKKVKYWEDQTVSLANAIRLKQGYIEDQSKVTADGDPNAIQAYSQKRAEHEAQLFELQRTYELVNRAMADQATGKRRRTTPEEWTMVDPSLQTKVNQRNGLETAIRGLIATFGVPNHPQVQSRMKELDGLKEEIRQYVEDLDAKYLFVMKPDGSGIRLSKEVALIEQQVRDLQAQIKTQTQQLEALRQASARVATAREDLQRLFVKQAEADAALSEWKFRKDSLSLTNILSDGSVAKPDKDRRPIFAAIGFMGGAGIPIGLLLLFGLFDTRYRYSDETHASAANSGLGGLTLLGILPNLPDRLSDPEQAAIAAHCVHQIRTMLQINTGLEDRRVFAVTSASPGDGKTSLTLALGLSYAACGTRTLLVDCDLIGSGLSSRMNVSAPEGVLEAITNRSLLPFVRQTDVADVSILPVGSAGGLHASTLSPQALRRLIEEAEQHYEVVLIDTGPILGSIEASLVCAAADAVILTVSRGQQRPMVERSLGHLAAIGARLAGVVFNRAQAHDFERSISGVSMRSVGVPGLPRGTRPAGPRLGPVARAVQSQAPNAANGDGTHDGNGHHE